MSRFLTEKFNNLSPYVPGEQPKGEKKYIKLNTNESPFPPSPKAVEYARRQAEKLNLYSDPECRSIVRKIADYYGVGQENVIVTNGSDEVLNFAFMAYCDRKKPAYFADITYGFYKVFASLNNIPYTEIPLREDFSINIDDYKDKDGTIFIANPNAPTGILLTTDKIEELVSAHSDRIVVIDEAYIDFGGKSAVQLVGKYDNILVTQTFSKSRSMAGARLGFGIGSKDIINDLNRIRFSTNPYNVNKMTMFAGVGAMEDETYFTENCRKIISNREFTTLKLREMGFKVLDSSANFVFAKSDVIDGGTLYEKLKKRGILVRHFDKERIRDYIRVTIGSITEMEEFISVTKDIIKEKII